MFETPSILILNVKQQSTTKDRVKYLEFVHLFAVSCLHRHVLGSCLFHSNPLDGSRGTRLPPLRSASTLAGSAPVSQCGLSSGRGSVCELVEAGIPRNPSYSFVNGG